MKITREWRPNHQNESDLRHVDHRVSQTNRQFLSKTRKACLLLSIEGLLEALGYQ